MECVVSLVESGEFHDDGSTHASSFREYPTALIGSKVGRSQCGGCVLLCRSPLRSTRSLRSLLELGGSTSKMLNIAECHHQVKQKRDGFLHKLSNYYATEHDVVAVKELNVRSMLESIRNNPNMLSAA